MALKFYPEGLGAAIGDTLVTCEPLYRLHAVVYVHSGTGTDTDNFGLTRAEPLATLRKAIELLALATATDHVVVLMDGHEETLSTTLEIDQAGTIVVAEGDLGAELTTAATSGAGIEVSADKVQFRNIRFPAATAAAVSFKIDIQGDWCRMIGCRVELGEHDGTGVVVSGDGSAIRETYIVGDASYEAGYGLITNGTAGFHGEGITLDAVTCVHGFLSAGSCSFSERLTLVNTAHVSLHTSEKFLVQVISADQDSAVQWAGDGMDVWPAGLGEDAGDTLAAEGHIYTNYEVVFLRHSGSDSNSGASENRPKATLAAAVAALGGEPGVVVAMQGHAETLTASVELETGQVLVGGGQSGGEPAVTFTINSSSDFAIEADDYAQVRNCNFYCGEGEAAPLGQALEIGGPGVFARSCYFYGPAEGTGSLVSSSGATKGFRLHGCVFRSAGTAAGQPSKAIYAELAAVLVEMSSCVVDSLEHGWAVNPVQLTVATAWVESMSMLRGADANLEGTAAGFFNPQTTTGGARVTW